MSANGKEADLLKIPGGGCRFPPTAKTLEDRLHTLKMEGKEIFKTAVKVMCEATLEAAKLGGITLDQVDLVIPHQANSRIIQAISDRLGTGPDRMFMNLDRVGNTSAASVILALDEAVQKGLVKEGHKVVLVAFGAGTTLASALIRW
jgi:3-oxoacyl-[acyl-carrier-protein] synthase-3